MACNQQMRVSLAERKLLLRLRQLAKAGNKELLATIVLREGGPAALEIWAQQRSRVEWLRSNGDEGHE